MAKQDTSKEQTASMEDYLEGIAMLGKEGDVVRVSQLSRKLRVKMPSVTSALKKLSEQGLLEHEKYGYIKLTSEGQQLAKEVFRRHKALTRFFVEILGVDPKTAEDDACKIEHVISPSSMERLMRFVEFIESCSSRMAKLPESCKCYEYYLKNKELLPNCLEERSNSNQEGKA